MWTAPYYARKINLHADLLEHGAAVAAAGDQVRGVRGELQPSLGAGVAEQLHDILMPLMWDNFEIDVAQYFGLLVCFHV